MYASGTLKKIFAKTDASKLRRDLRTKGEKMGEATTMDTETHTAHSDTILLRNGKRGWAGGSAGQYRGPRRTGGGSTDRNPHPSRYTKKTH